MSYVPNNDELREMIEMLRREVDGTNHSQSSTKTTIRSKKENSEQKTKTHLDNMKTSLLRLYKA